MAPLVHYLSFRKTLLLTFFFASSLFMFASSKSSETQIQIPQIHLGRKILLQSTDIQKEEGEQLLLSLLPNPKKKKPSSSSSSSELNQTKIQTKLPKSIASNSSTKNPNKLIKPITASSKNKTKLIQTTPPTTPKDVDDDSTNSIKTDTPKIKVKKLNSTKSSSSSSSASTKKSVDLLKTSFGAKNKTKSSQGSGKLAKDKSESQPEMTNKMVSDLSKPKNLNKEIPNQKKKSPPSWMYRGDEEDDDDLDLVSEFRDLPTKFQQTIIPDLRRISTSSKVYLSKANKEITKGFKPYVGNKYAASIATAISCAFIVVPFLLVSLIFNRIKAYFSLQRLLIFIQIYLSIYFSILCFCSLVTGLDPVRFFYTTSQSTYVWLQVLQTLGYTLYLLLLLMYLVLVFSTDTELGQRFLGLAQTIVGFSVGLHYYMTVFHRVVLRQPPKTNWKVHGIYATCFLLICLFTQAERRKKAYLEEGGEEGKKR